MAVGPLLVFKSEIGEGSDDLVTDFKIKSIFSKRNLCSEVSCHENCNKKAIMRLLPWVLLLILISFPLFFLIIVKLVSISNLAFSPFQAYSLLRCHWPHFPSLISSTFAKIKFYRRWNDDYMNDPVMERKYWMPTSALLCFLSSFLDYFTIVFVSFMIKHFLKLGVIQTLLLRSNLRLAWLLWLKPKQNLTMILENFGKS